jgi:hypothetical protein
VAADAVVAYGEVPSISSREHPPLSPAIENIYKVEGIQLKNIYERRDK